MKEKKEQEKKRKKEKTKRKRRVRVRLKEKRKKMKRKKNKEEIKPNTYGFEAFCANLYFSGAIIPFFWLKNRPAGVRSGVFATNNCCFFFIFPFGRSASIRSGGFAATSSAAVFRLICVYRNRNFWKTLIPRKNWYHKKSIKFQLGITLKIKANEIFLSPKKWKNTNLLSLISKMVHCHFQSHIKFENS